MYMSYLWRKVNVCVLEVILTGMFHLVGSSELNENNLGHYL